MGIGDSERSGSHHADYRLALRLMPMIMPNDQDNRPGFLQYAKGQVTLLVVAAILVVFLSMVLHLL
jgi:hypothetical protein